MPADNRDSYVRSAGEQGASSTVAALATESYKSIATDKKVSIDVRMSAAASLVKLNQRAAAEAYVSVIKDKAVVDAHRTNAVTYMAKLDDSAASASCQEIAGDKALEVAFRIPAAIALRRSEPKAAAPILFGIAAEYGAAGSSTASALGVTYSTRITALDHLMPIDGSLAIKAIQSIVMHETSESWRTGVLQKTAAIPKLDVQAAATMLNSVATTPTVVAAVRLAAANLLTQLLQPKTA